MKSKIMVALGLAAALAMGAQAAQADGDAAAGKRVFNRCKACHTYEQGDTARKQGPNLFGIVGRPAGTQEAFAGRYSDPMMGRNGEGLVWTPENIDEFITAPKTFMPGTKMAFAGLRNEQQRADVIAFLQTLQ